MHDARRVQEDMCRPCILVKDFSDNGPTSKKTLGMRNATSAFPLPRLDAKYAGHLIIVLAWSLHHRCSFLPMRYHLQQRKTQKSNNETASQCNVLSVVTLAKKIIINEQKQKKVLKKKNLLLDVATTTAHFTNDPTNRTEYWKWDSRKRYRTKMNGQNYYANKSGKISKLHKSMCLHS